MAGYSRIKRITQEERNARAQLKKMGVSEYELQRLYDANYKARKRAEFVGAKYGESLNLNWKNILIAAQKAVADGKTVSGYIKARQRSYKAKYKISEVKQNEIKKISGTDKEYFAGDWASELINKKLQKYSTEKILEYKVKALEDMEDAGELIPEPSSAAYKRAHARYKNENASTQQEWDNILKKEQAKEVMQDETFQDYIAQYIGVDVFAVRSAQRDAEIAVAGLSGATRERFLERKKQEAFDAFGGV